MFGAGVDSTISDTQSCQNAISSLNTGELVLTNTYIVSGLTLVSNMSITGTGKIIQKSGSNTSLLYGSGLTNVSIKTINIDGGSGQTSGGDKGLIYLLNCTHCTISGTTIANASANAIELPGCTKTYVSSNTITNTYSNAIIAGDVGGMDIVVDSNIIDTTTTQNGIFITASFGSIATANNIYRMVITNNIVKSAGDIGIELGQNSNNSIVSNNTIYNSTNANIIIRDVLNCVVNSNTIMGNTGGNITNWGGIIVSPLNKIAYDYNLVISGNNISIAAFVGIDINTSGVSVEGNHINCVTDKPAGSSGIRTYYSNNQITGNFISSFYTGIMISENFTGATITGVNITGNTVLKSVSAIVAWNHAITDLRISGNSAKEHTGVAYKSDSCSLTMAVGNQFILENNTATNPSLFYSGTSYYTSNTNILTVPIIQWSGTPLLPPGYGAGRLSIELSNGGYAVIDVYNQTGSGDGIGYNVVLSSAGITGNAAATAWSITKESTTNTLILKRTGATITGPIYMFVTWLH
jgi:hypothetical protein